MNNKNNKKITKSIYFLGPEGSYTQIAADQFVTKIDNITLVEKPQGSILKVIESIDNNIGDIGIVPIENSIEGIVRESIDNLLTSSSRVMIGGEIILPITHCLISKSNDMSTIKNIASHPQALAQCRYYIAKNFGNKAKTEPLPSTSEAVKRLNNLDETWAAIGTAGAAELYDLNILDRDINDVKDNYTRFLLLTSEPCAPTGNDKSSIVFSTANTPGALVDILKAFKENGINLSYIESRPSKRVFGDYSFFIDFDGHIEDESVKKTIGTIIPKITFYKFLGSYPKAGTEK